MESSLITNGKSNTVMDTRDLVLVILILKFCIVLNEFARGANLTFLLMGYIEFRVALDQCFTSTENHYVNTQEMKLWAFYKG